MSTFIKAENALKRSEELLAVSRPTEALETLRSALFTRRFKFAWTEAMEDIVKSYIRLSFELREVRNLKDGLLQYRSAGNVSSFDRCVRFLLDHAQTRLMACPTTSCTVDVTSEEAIERPEQLLLRAFTMSVDCEGMTRKSALRDLWETLRTAMEVTRAHAPFEDLYHEVARSAVDFCVSQKRTGDFRRLCELLRLHYAYLPKQATTAPVTGPQVVSGNNPETLLKQLDTRMSQLTACIELELYSTAFTVAEDIQTLMTKKRPSPSYLKNYFERLSELFAHMNTQLFHAFALLKFVSLAKLEDANLFSKNPGLADKLVLACLAALAPADASVAEVDSEVTAERNAKLAALVSAGGAVPTVDLLFTELVTKGLMTSATVPVQAAFHNLVDSDGRQVHALLKEHINGAAQAVRAYVAQIDRAVFAKAVAATAAVYARMPLTAFKEELCADVGDFSECERLLLALRRTGAVDVKIDYVAEVVHFGRAAGARVRDFSKLEELKIDLVADREAIRARKAAVAKRREKLADEAAKAEVEKQRRAKEQEARDAEMLRKLKEDEARRKETELREKVRFSRELEKAKDLDERLKDEKLRKEYLAAPDSKTLATVVREMEKALDAKIKKEIATKLQQRKSEFKKVNLVAKVMRYEEAKKIETVWKPQIAANDKAYFDGIRQKQIEAEQKAAEAKKVAVALLGDAKDMLFKFRDEKLRERQEKLNAKIEAAKQAHHAKHSREAVEAALQRFLPDDEDEELYYEEMARTGSLGDIIRVDSTQSRDDFRLAK